MEDSRKDKRDGEKGLSMPNPYMDGENGKKAIIRKGELSSEGTRACLRILLIQIYAYNSFLLTR